MNKHRLCIYMGLGLLWLSGCGRHHFSWHTEALYSLRKGQSFAFAPKIRLDTLLDSSTYFLIKRWTSKVLTEKGLCLDTSAPQAVVDLDIALHTRKELKYTPVYRDFFDANQRIDYIHPLLASYTVGYHIAFRADTVYIPEGAAVMRVYDHASPAL